MKSVIILLFVIVSFQAFSQVGIGTNSPDPSAKLDVTSTNKGFLPPRMTQSNRNSIINPAAGLMIYCTDCGTGSPQFYNGSSWINMTGNNAIGNIAIGSIYQGGIIFYIDGTGQHGLIASTLDQSSGIQWYNGTSVATGATGTSIGTGLANTNAIIQAQGAASTNYAAGLAKAYNGGGYTDWYLPSKDELNSMYIHIGAGAPSPLTNVGGFNISSRYWSSSEYDRYTAYSQVGSGQGNDNKPSQLAIRSIRSF